MSIPPLPPFLLIVCTDNRFRPLCQHCHIHIARPRSCGSRGLCWTCYCDRLIRVRYRPLRASSPEDTDCADRPLPDEPTTARPGTPEKIRVMQARRQAGRHLHHPLDATLGG